MWNAIRIIRGGIKTGDLGNLIEKTANSFGFNVIRSYTGHGIGLEFHMKPSINFYGQVGVGDVINSDTCITIEPMLVDGNEKTTLLSDGLSARVNNLSAQFEHTIYVFDDGYEVLTYNEYDESQGMPRTNRER